MTADLRDNATTPPRPAAQSTHTAPEQQQPHFLDSVTIDFGPREILGPFFIRAYNEVVACGCTLEFSNLETLRATNISNRTSWPKLLPIFDSTESEAADDNCICVVARDAAGRIVCTQAVRKYDIQDNLCDATESLRLFYDGRADEIRQSTPERWIVGDRAREVSKTMSGLIVFSGAAWCHPEQRGGHLTRLLARICRAYAVAKWQPNYIVTFMAENVVKGGFATKAGHRHIEWAVESQNACVGDVRAALLWLTPLESIEDIREFLERPAYRAPLDLDRRANQTRLAGR